ncbi:MAG: dockerin type I repeat-containing protein [Lachnospiraceae bacterium]
MSLHGTNVSDKDRWKLADFKDFTMIKGEQSVLPTLGPIFEEGLSVETINNKDCIEILRDGSEGSVEILAKEAGETRLHISYNDLSTDITVKVEGISANQEVGEDFSIEIQPRRSTSAKSLYSDEGLILDSNHQLWQLYPKAVKKKDNVKDYVANWVYYGTDHKDAEVRTYLLDNDKKLWKGTEKLAENVERFDGRYALDTQGILHNVYNDGNEKVENVEDWISPSVSDEGIAYLLKTDGTLWKRRERIGSQAPDEWKQIGSNIKQLYDEGYLKKDGTLVSFDGSQTTDIKADFMCETGSFYDKEGNFYFRAVEWNANTGKYDSDYINVGKIDVKQAQKYDKDIYLLNQNKQVYKYNILTNKLELLMSDVLRISETSWAFQTSNGRYYDWECKAMSSARIGYAGYDYDLIWREDGSQMVERNGVPILNNVTLIWRDYLEGSYRTYACRTDGTIWDITEVPKQILDLSVSSYIRGDVNEDGDVNIKDLQIILRGVCEKIELTERQKLIADVVEDGKVDIKDLQKELRFVCGKIEEL